LGLPKFLHVLSFRNWLEIRNQLGSWVLKQQQQGRKKNTHNHHNNNNNNKRAFFCWDPLPNKWWCICVSSTWAQILTPHPPNTHTHTHTHTNTLVVYIQICVCIQHMVSGLVFKSIGFCLINSPLIVPQHYMCIYLF
jgi:hypothetical protein